MAALRQSTGPRWRRFHLEQSTWLVVLIAVFALLWYTRNVLLVIFAGILFALFLQSLASWVKSWSHLGYRWSLAATVLFLIVSLGLVLWLFGNRIADQAVRLSHTLPDSMQRMREQLEKTEQGKLVAQQLENLGQWFSSGEAGAQLTSGAMTAVNGLIALVMLAFIGLYGAIAPQVYIGGFVRLVPPAYHERAATTLQVLSHDLRHWMLGHLTTMFVVGLLATAGLWLLGIPEAFILGLLAFFAELVPYIGPILASIPAILLGWSQSTTAAVEVIVLYLGIHVVEGYILFPWIMRRAIKLPPAITICGIVIFGMLGGLLGAILATPLTLVLMILIKKLYIESLVLLPAQTDVHEPIIGE
jgi:predicted PurR-regulated permease PerM